VNFENSVFSLDKFNALVFGFAKANIESNIIYYFKDIN